MKRRGLVLTVATSADGAEVDALLDRAGVADLIDTGSSSSDAAGSKPEPDIVLAAMARSGLPDDALVMLGDTPYDIESARRAGVPIIALRAGGSPDDALAGADEVYDDPADLLAHYDRSLLARR
jgi:phosphoglycolate phosphatase-like HAD superfamily hydrolase